MPYDPLVNADGSYFVAPSQSDKSRRDLVDQYGLYSEDLVPMDDGKTESGDDAAAAGFPEQFV